MDDDVLNAFCWMYSSFDIPPDFEGICTRRETDGTRLYNSYYQWVSIFLGSQAVLFYIPRCIWLMLEGGLMSYIVKGRPMPVVSFFRSEFSPSCQVLIGKIEVDGAGLAEQNIRP